VADKITQKGAELLAVPVEQNKCDINFLMDELSKRSIAQLLVEGGPTVITSFLKQRLADEIVVYIAPKILGQQGSVSISEPMAELTEAVGLHYVDIKRFGDDVRIAGLSEKVISEMSIVKG
jgi:diaminohydroxyphosphoribosylaminopyrimidine deaminase/5-amino-6-(5-phosphoribosylamino)uracil reductase